MITHILAGHIPAQCLYSLFEGTMLRCEDDLTRSGPRGIIDQITDLPDIFTIGWLIGIPRVELIDHPRTVQHLGHA